MKRALLAALAVLVLLCLLVAALCLRRAGAVGGAPGASGAPRRGPDPALSPHVVVDTLNLVHWLHRDALQGGAPLTPALVAETVACTAPALKARHPGTVVYVVKDRESRLNDDAARLAYKAAAELNRVSVAVVERYADPPSRTAKPSAEHSALGRDDFYLALLAWRYRCAVLTEDRLRDFDRFRATIPPFQVYEYAFWRDQPHREFIRPDSLAFARVRKPRAIRFAEAFGEPPAGRAA